MLSQKKISFITSLQQKKYRKEADCFVLEGDKMVEEAIRRNARLELLVGSDQWIAENQNLIARSGIMVEDADLRTLKKISSMKTSPQVMALAKKKNVGEMKIAGRILMLDDIRDPGNLGTILRTAEWFGINRIICSTSSVDQYNPKTVQASMGSVFSMQLLYADLNDFTSKHSEMSIYVSDSSATTDIRKLDVQHNCFIVVGNESFGVSESIVSKANATFKIMGKGAETESLNAAIATGIVLYELCSNN